MEHDSGPPRRDRGTCSVETRTWPSPRRSPRSSTRPTAAGCSRSAPPTTYNRESTAYFNATCGPTIYRGDVLGDAYRGNAFVCESLTNLVQRRVLDDRGATFLARRVEPDREFLASTDPSFRPVNLTTGPDASRSVSSTSTGRWSSTCNSFPKNSASRSSSAAGTIGDVCVAHHEPGREASLLPALGKVSTAELVATLEDPNGWRWPTRPSG